MVTLVRIKFSRFRIHSMNQSISFFLLILGTGKSFEVPQLRSYYIGGEEKQTTDGQIAEKTVESSDRLHGVRIRTLCNKRRNDGCFASIN